MESAFERSKRRRSDTIKKVFSREAEAEEVRPERLAKDVIRHSNTRVDESWPTLRIKADTEMCWQCFIDHGSDQTGLLTSENNMNPGSVPPLLRDLSTLEEMLISQIALMMNVFRLPSGRQYGYSGHVLNLPQDVQPVVNSLPRTASNLGTVIVRRKRISGNVMEFRVRRDRVYAALVFLKRNNYYSNIKIDSVALDALPEDGELKELQTIEIDDDWIDDVANDISPVGANAPEADACKTGEGNDDNIEFSHSVLPSTSLGLTETEKIRKVINKINNKPWYSAKKQSSEQKSSPSDDETVDESSAFMKWPTCGSTPISEFTTEGY